MKASIESEVNRILPCIPTTPPDDTLEIIQGRGYLRDDRLIYGCEWVYDPYEKKKVRKVKVVCTKCGGEAYLPYVESGCGRYGGAWGFLDPTNSATTDGGTCLCPTCMVGTTAMHRPSRNSSRLINDHIFMSIHNVLGHLVLLSWHIAKYVRSDGTVFYKSQRYEGAVIVEKTIVRIRGYYKFMTSLTWLDHWEVMQRFDYQFGAYSSDEVIYSDYSETDGTECEKSALVGYLKAQGALYPTEYLKIWLKHPNVENLITAGYTSILQDVIHNATGYFKGYYKENFEIKRVEAILDLKKTRPIDILKIDPEDIPTARSGGIERLQFYKQIKKCFGIMLDGQQLDFCKTQVYMNVNELIEFGKRHGHDVKLIRLLNYLAAQRDKQKEVYDRSLVDAKHLKDYWSMLYEVYGELPRELLYPKDLKGAHDQIQMRVEEKKNADVDKSIKGRVEELSIFGFIDEKANLLIRPAASYREFINEGKKLNHCVARYAEDHSKGKTNIFFIRHVDKPNTPYFTLELNIDKLTACQNRGKGNCARTPEVELFEAKWLDHIKDIMRKSRRKKNKEQVPVQIGA